MVGEIDYKTEQMEEQDIKYDRFLDELVGSFVRKDAPSGQIRFGISLQKLGFSHDKSGETKICTYSK